MPLNCIGWYAASALCQFLGGDLPTHAEWEYAATSAGHDHKTQYPWGDDAPDCDRAVWGRAPFQMCGGDLGPANVNDPPWAQNDVTPLGVVGLGGNVGEWTRDSFRGYADACWWTRPLRGVGCDEVNAPLRSMRGGSYDVPYTPGLLAADMLGQPVSYPVGSFGVRCARKGAP
jgi:formylglycine-generating enzyme required for sulfatase activity